MQYFIEALLKAIEELFFRRGPPAANTANPCDTPRSSTDQNRFSSRSM